MNWLKPIDNWLFTGNDIIKGSLDAKLPSYELLKMLKVIDS